MTSSPQTGHRAPKTRGRRTGFGLAGARPDGFAKGDVVVDDGGVATDAEDPGDTDGDTVPALPADVMIE